MKRFLLFPVLFLLVFPDGLRAQNRGQDRTLGAGMVIGYPLGVSGKYWLNPRTAFDAAFSVVSSNELYLHVSYLVHDFTAFPGPETGSLPFYYGLGPQVSGDKFGIRVPFGIEYIFSDYPFGIFMELAPVFRLAPGFDLNFTGGIGARYYFSQ